jgi:hypothetical protein
MTTDRFRWMFACATLEAQLSPYRATCPGTVERIMAEAWAGDCSRWAEEPEPRDDDHPNARPKRAAYATAIAWLREVAS